MDDFLETPSSWGVRLAMASRGWISKSVLSRGFSPEDLFCRVWFTRWDWHGRRCDRVDLSSGSKLEIGDAAASARLMDRSIRRAAGLALKAWNTFPDSIPRQEMGGELTEEPIGTRIIFRESIRKPDYFPSERMPDDVALFCDADVPDATSAAALRYTDVGDYEDCLTYMHRTASLTDIDRRWGFVYTATLRDWHGQRVMPHRFRFSLDELLESMVEMSLDASRMTIARLGDRYRPDGRRGLLPPGFTTVRDAVLDRERKQRSKDVRCCLQLHDDEAETESAVSWVMELWSARWNESRVVREAMPQPTRGEVRQALEQAALSDEVPVTERFDGV